MSQRNIFSFSSLNSKVKDTCLVRYQDTVYKVKFLGDAVANKSDSVLVQEINECVRTVFFMLHNDKPVVKIQTPHFLCVTSSHFWSTGQRVHFEQKGKPLKVFSDVVNLHFTLKSESRHENGCVSDVQTQNTRQEINLRKPSAQKDLAQPKAHDAMVKPPQNVKAREPIRKSPWSTSTLSENNSALGSKGIGTAAAVQPVSEDTDVRDNLPREHVATKVFQENPQSPPHKRLRTPPAAQNEANQDSGKSSSNLIDTLPGSSAIRPSSATRSMTDRSYSQSDAAPNRNNSNVQLYRDAVQSDESSSPSKRKRVRPVLEFASEGAELRSKQNRSNDAASRRHIVENPQEAEIIQPSSSTMAASSKVPMERSRRRIRIRQENVNSIFESEKSRQTVSRGSIAEEHRLRNLASRAPEVEPTASQTFQQKDRYAVECGDAEEELNLQALAMGEARPDENQDNEKRSASNTQQSLLQRMLTPVSWLFRGRQNRGADHLE